MTYSIPYSFIPGTKARAQEVNANFKYVLDTADEINTNKLNTSLSNITPEAIDIIRNCTSFRNIGEIIQSTAPLTDSGLHLLDGALLTRGSYADFVDYISDLYDANDVFNDVFNVVGAPVFTNTSIVSGFSGSNYLTVDFALSGAWEITFKLNLTNLSDFLSPVVYYSNYNRIFVTPQGYITIFADENDSAAGSFNLFTSNLLSINTNYIINISYDGINTYSAKCTNLDTNATITDSVTTNYKFISAPKTWKIGSDSSRYLRGAIDLKSFSVYDNAQVIICGNKVQKYFIDESKWQNSINQYGICDKFVYDSVNNTVRLPKYGKDSTITDTNTLPVNLYYIVVATATQTDIMVDIDNITTDLNGKADKDLTNVTTGAFEHVLGTAQQVGKDIVINWGMPDYTAGISISAVPYTCPCNGIVVSPYNITINGSQIFTFYSYSGVNTPNSMTAPVCQGDAISGNVAELKFYPLKGES